MWQRHTVEKKKGHTFTMSIGLKFAFGSVYVLFVSEIWR